jgi:chorismate-pyruvate lyase
MIQVLQILALTIAGFPAVAGNWNSYFRGAWRCLILIALLAVFTPAHAQEPPAWPDTFLARLEALALIQTLNAEILGSRSATRSLENWCRDHRLADAPIIQAHMITGVNKPPTEEQRRRLMVNDQSEVKYRRVQLRCGSHLLSEAENWYVPSRLTPEMNRLLETTKTPFGKVVESMEPYRRSFAVKILWAPLADGWEQDPGKLPTATGDILVIPDALFEHRAILYSREHRPFAEVSEVYQRQILAFPPPLQRAMHPH